jgi:hypothetical protein
LAAIEGVKSPFLIQVPKVATKTPATVHIGATVIDPSSKVPKPPVPC